MPDPSREDPDEHVIDLAAYFQRIGYGGPIEPTLTTLAGLVQSHVATMPFEAMDAYTGRAPHLTPSALESKLVGLRRGGWCAEQNGLFRLVLLALGFKVDSLIARGVAGRVRPRLHQVLLVEAEGEQRIVDVGNGAATPTAPLRLTFGVAQETPHGPVRVVHDGHEMTVEFAGPDAWEPAYSMSSDPQHIWDFETSNWWSSSHPSSWYRTNLVCTLAPTDVRILMLNNRLTVRRFGAPDEHQWLDVDGMERCLETVFGMPVEPGWRRHLQRAMETGNNARG